MSQNQNQSQNQNTNTNQNKQKTKLNKSKVEKLSIVIIVLLLIGGVIFIGFQKIPEGIALAVLVYFVLRYYLKTKYIDPLSEKQIQKLAERKTKADFRNVKFEKILLKSDDVKDVMFQTDRWLNVHIPQAKFPSCFANFAQDETAQWTVLGLECNGIIEYIWSSKDGSSSIPLDSGANDVVKKCKAVGANTIIRLHNQPKDSADSVPSLKTNSNIIKDSKAIAKHMSDNGINWRDFITSDDQFKQFNSSLANNSLGYRQHREAYIDVNEIGSDFNYQLQMEYMNKCGHLKIVLVICFALYMIAGMLLANNIDVVKDIFKRKAPEPEPVQVVEEQKPEPVATTKQLTEYYAIKIRSTDCDSYYHSSKTNTDFTADFTVDGDIATCWQDGRSDEGVGDSLTYNFTKQTIYKIGIVNGNRTKTDSYSNNSRLATATLTFYDSDNEVYRTTMTFEDNADIEETTITLNNGVKCSSITITIDEVYKGARYSDTGISEVKIYSMR